jgi:uncharacterized protein
VSRLTGALARLVVNRPAMVLAVIALLTVGAAVAATQQEQVEETGEDAPGRAADASDLVEEHFGVAAPPVQVLVRTPGRDARNAGALLAVRAIDEAVREGELGERLSGPGGAPPVLGYLTPAVEALEVTGADPAELDDTEVRRLQEEAVDTLPEQLVDQVAALLGAGDPPEAGLVLVFLDETGLDDDGRLALQQEVADRVRAVDVPEGVLLEPFSVRLLLDEGDIAAEVGQLFAAALGLILVLLAAVLWVKPASGHTGRVVRRTAADVLLILLVILGAVIWMQGIGVLLGPDYAGLIGYFSPQTQVVPVLIVGLGVDYAIHLQTRYRDGLAAGDGPDRSVLSSARTVGVALLLATLTTAIGFLTNLTSPFEALATLGVLAAVGIGSALVLTLTVLPAVRLLLDRRAVRRGSLPVESLANREQGALYGVAVATSRLAERVPWVTLAVAGALGIGGIWGFTQLEREFTFTDFVPQDAAGLDTLETIEEEFDGGFGGRTTILIAGDLATVETHDALVESLAAMADVDGVARAGGRADAQSPVSALRSALSEEPAVAHGLPQLDAGTDDLRLGATGAAAGDVAELYDSVLEAVPEQAEEVLAEVDGELWGRVTVRTTVDEGAAGGLADDLEAAFAPLAQAGAEVTATSLDIVAADLTDRIERAQLISIALALSVVGVLLAVYYGLTHRRPVLGPVTVAPVVLVLAWTFGTMALTGIPLTPVTATLAALSIGVGIDFSIHVVNRFQEAAEADPDAGHAQLLRTTTGETGSALLALTTVLGFGVLVTSTLVPFRQLGLVTMLAIGYSLLAALLVLPSLLRLTTRRSPPPR